MYEVRGYSQGDMTILFESDSCSECIRWTNGYVKYGYGGYPEISVVDTANDEVMEMWIDHVQYCDEVC